VTGSLERGFKTRAEKLALQLRLELGLTPYDRLDPRALAQHLGIAIMNLRDLVAYGANQSSVSYFIDVAPEELSALTIREGNECLIVENPRHSTGRRSSTLTHELSHVILKHAPGPALGVGGCRRWNQKDEDEADWLAGVLLVPRPIALRFARLETPVAVAAFNMGVSVPLLQWRMNHTGAAAQAQRERLARSRRPG